MESESSSHERLSHSYVVEPALILALASLFNSLEVNILPGHRNVVHNNILPNIFISFISAVFAVHASKLT